MKKFKRVYVEITNICNLNCSFCPKHNRENKFMSVAEFSHVLSQVAPLTNAVCLHLMGEPLLHPNLSQILYLCKECNVDVYLTTNGTLLKDNVQLLSNGNCKRVSISLHSFEANSSKVSLKQYLQDVFEAANQIAQSSGSYVEFRLWNESESQNAHNTLNDQIVQAISNYFGVEVDLSTHQKRYDVAPNVYVGFDDLFEWPIESSNGTKTQQKFCHGLRTHFGVLCDGTVVACCLDNNGNLALGNIFQQDVTQILQCERAQSICKGFSAHNATEPFCQTCTFANKFLAK